MSKYTTEVRYICESAIGMTVSGGGNEVDDIIASAIPYVFNFDFPIFDEKYRTVLETKILRHYYTREIAHETVGLWKFKLKTKLNEIMPYYNKLYESELIKIDPLYTHNLTRTHTTEFSSDRTTGDESQTTGSSDYTNTNTKNLTNTDTKNLTNRDTKNLSTQDTRNLTDTDLYSDTPQGSLTNVDNQTYLTNARKKQATGTDTVTETGTDTMTQTGTDTLTQTGTDTLVNEATNSSQTISSGDDTFESTESYIENIIGYEGKDVSDLLIKWRSTFLNIDMLVIEELEPLFFQLW